MRASLPPWGRLILLLALVLRIGWVAFAWQRYGAEFKYPDEALHWQLAMNLVEHGTLVSDLGPDGRYAARMPLYPLFLAVFAGAGMVGVLLARLAQALLGAATAWLAYRQAQAACGARAAIIAGLLCACDPFGIFFANLLLTETLFTPLLVGLSACAWRLATDARDRAALVGVALLGAAAVLARPSAAALVPLMWLAVLWLAADRRRLWPRLLVCPVVLGVCLLPWGLRNKAVIGAYAWLSTNGGVTLYDAQGPQADGSSNQAFLDDPRTNPADGVQGEVARDRALRDAALEHIRRDPGRVVRLAGVKLLRTWSPVPNVAEYRGGAVALVSAAYTVPVLIGALVGLCQVCRRKAVGPRRLMLLLWLAAAYFTVVHCVYVGSVRYRVPLMPLLSIAAAGMLLPQDDRVRRRPVAGAARRR